MSAKANAQEIKSLKNQVKKLNVKKPKQKRKTRSGGGSGTDAILAGHLRMLLDPCGSTLVPSAYAGQKGFVQRFSVTYYYSSANPYRIFSWAPGRFRSWMGDGADDTTGLTPSYGGLVPGYDWMGNNCQNARCLAACVDVSYMGTELDRKGQIAVGVVPLGTLKPGQITNTRKTSARLAVKTRIPDKDFSIKWFPGEVDSEYVYPQDATPGGDDFDQANAIVFTNAGLPSGSQLAVTLTAIYEWNPRMDTDTVVTTVAGASVPGAVSQINNHLHKAGRFWTNIGETAETAAHTLSAAYAGVTNTFRVAKGVASMAAPLLL